MPQYYQYVTALGVIVPDTSTVLVDIQNEWKAVFGADFDVSPETPQGRMIEADARNRIFCIQITAAVANMLNLGKAYGFVLDDLGSLFLISRKPAIHTQTTVILAGVAGTIIPAGTRVQSEAGDIFLNDASYTIGDDGSVQTLYRSENTGAVPAVPDTLTTILDSVNGLETATNPGNPTLGEDQESDNVFRNRIRTSLNLNSISIISAIKSNVENLPGVAGSFCYDNFDDVAVIIDSVNVPAHSIMAVVDGGDEQQIANVLYQKKTLGTGYVLMPVGPTPYTVIEKTVIDEAYGTAYKVRFVRPILTDIGVKITVKRQKYSGDDLAGDVTKAILNFATGENSEVDGIVIGGSLSPFEISAAVSNQIPDIFITEVKIGPAGGTLATNTMTFGQIHKANILQANIEVVITEA